MFFDTALWRFATSGTLILAYGIADLVARRRERGASKPPSPVWLRPLALVSITAFYFLIRPAGGALLGGVGNLAGVALVLLATFMRLGRTVRHPELAGRALFYLALPIAVGVPLGLLVLSLPAVLASLWCCRRAERQEPRRFEAGAGPRFRMVPGIW